jgi:hypothetical protein
MAERPKRQRTQLISEFIVEKREIYLFQLFIDTKQKEIRTFRREESNEENGLTNEKKRIADEIEFNKMATIQFQAYIAHARKMADRAAQESAYKTRILRRLQASLEAIRSDISKNEATLEQYIPYSAYLETMTPAGEDFGYFFGKPDVLIEEMAKLERDTLHVITHYQHRENLAIRGIESKHESIRQITESEQQIRDKLPAIPEVQSKHWKVSAQHQEEEDTAYTNLINRIEKTFENCFHIEANMAPLLMLERIENDLERMYELCDRVSPEFLAYKQANREKERRDQQRKEWQEKREKEQQRKVEQARERARKPIPRKTSRPIVQRFLPIGRRNVDDLVLQQKMREQEAEERLLYQPSEDEYLL